MKIVGVILICSALAGAAAAPPPQASDPHALYEEYLDAVGDGNDVLAETAIEAAWRAARQTLARYHPDTALFAFTLAQIRIVNGDLAGAQEPAAFALEAAVYAQHYREDEARILYGASLADTTLADARVELEAGFAEWDRLLATTLGAPPKTEVLNRLYSWSWVDRFAFEWYLTLPQEVERRVTAGVGPRDDIIAARLYLASLQAAADSTAAAQTASLAHYDLMMPPPKLFAPQSARKAQFLLKVGQIEYFTGQYEKALSAFSSSAAMWRVEGDEQWNVPPAYLPSGQMAPGLAAAFAWLALATETMRALGEEPDQLFYGGPRLDNAGILPGRNFIPWPLNYGRDCRFRWQKREPLALARGDRARLGAVTLQFDFDERGEVTNARIAGAAPVSSPEHEAAILAAAETWRANFSTPFSVPRGCRTNQMDMVHYYY